LPINSSFESLNIKPSSTLHLRRGHRHDKTYNPHRYSYRDWHGIV
jgi:hypothetical protein